MKPNNINIIILTIAALSGAIVASADINTEKVRPIETTPIMARLNEEGKTILLTVTIRPDGSVKDAIAVSPDDYDKLLADRVVQSVKKWTFEPATNETGKRQEVTVNLPVHIAAVEEVKST